MIELVLDRSMLARMLGDKNFYAVCPEFLHLQDLATACYTKYIETFDRDCNGCADAAIMVPAVTEFVRHCKRLQEDHAARLNCVKDYIASRRPQRPDRVVVHHKADGRPAKLVF